MKFLEWLAKTFPKPKAMKLFAKRMVADPEYGEALSEMLRTRGEMIHAAESAPPPTDEEIDVLVAGLMSTNELLHRIGRIRLLKGGARAERALLAALDNRRCHWEAESDGIQHSPGERIADLLWELECRDLGAKIGHRADSPDWQVYQVAIKARVAIGSRQQLEFAVSKLNCGESIAADAVREGVEAALKRGTATPEFVAGILEWSRANVMGGSDHPSKWAVEFFAEHGGQNAMKLLQVEPLLSLSNDRNIHFLLDELNRRGLPIDHSLLKAMIEKSRASEEQWPWEYVFEGALASMATNDPLAARGIADAALNSSCKTHRRAAMDLIRSQEGLPRFIYLEPPPDLSLSPTEQTIVDATGHVIEASGQIGNGGLSQYFFNSAGDRWPGAVRAFRFIGDEEGAITLERAARILAAEGASIDRGVRQQQYAELSEEREKELDELSRAFWSDRMDPIELRFMRTNKDFYHKIMRARLERGLRMD
jgi:hypothetical protein